MYRFKTPRPCSPCVRYRSLSAVAATDLRERLMTGVKTAMRSKDTLASTTLRAVLADVYAADKTSSEKIASSAIVSIIRKGRLRRAGAAEEYTRASRPDLAERERKEIDVLDAYLPDLLSDEQIKSTLQEVLRESKGDLNLGMLFKGFYAKIDKSLVDAALVKKHAEKILAGSN